MLQSMGFFKYKNLRNFCDLRKMAIGVVTKKNVLLVKTEVGHARPTVYDLPADSHTYGKQVARDPDNCAATGKSLMGTK